MPNDRKQLERKKKDEQRRRGQRDAIDEHRRQHEARLRQEAEAIRQRHITISQGRLWW
jgi:hypothetical protein